MRNLHWQIIYYQVFQNIGLNNYLVLKMSNNILLSLWDETISSIIPKKIPPKKTLEHFVAQSIRRGELIDLCKPSRFSLIPTHTPEHTCQPHQYSRLRVPPIKVDMYFMRWRLWSTTINQHDLLNRLSRGSKRHDVFSCLHFSCCIVVSWMIWWSWK